MKKNKTKLILTIFVLITFLGCTNPKESLPNGILTRNDWFVEEGNQNNLYKSTIEIRFNYDSNSVEAWEADGNHRACNCTEGSYTINDKRNQIIIQGIENENCPWMKSLNGTYIYVYDKSRDGYNKFMFKKEQIIITHYFYEDRLKK
jgi:hypothetical protein